MGRILNALLAALTPAVDDGRRKTAPVVIGPSSGRVAIAPSRKVVVGPTPVPVVEKVKRPAWDEQGWIRTVKDRKAIYVGHFRATQHGMLRRFPGRLVEEGRDLKAYIADPPPEIKSHRKGPCFALVQAPWFRVHWRRAPKDPDNAILYVETVLDESLNR